MNSLQTVNKFVPEVLRALGSLSLGILALAIACSLFLINHLGDSQPEPGNWVLSYVVGIFWLWLALLGLAAPIWLIAWLPLRLRYFSRFPEKGLPPFSAVVVIGGLGGIIDICALMLFLGHAYYASQPPMVYFVVCAVPVALGLAAERVSGWRKY